MLAATDAGEAGRASTDQQPEAEEVATATMADSVVEEEAVVDEDAMEEDSEEDGEEVVGDEDELASFDDEPDEDMADAEMLEEAASAGPSVRQFANGKLPEKVKTNKVKTGKVRR